MGGGGGGERERERGLMMRTRELIAFYAHNVWTVQSDSSSSVGHVMEWSFVMSLPVTEPCCYCHVCRVMPGVCVCAGPTITFVGVTKCGSRPYSVRCSNVT